jgi:hypothetical protein
MMQFIEIMLYLCNKFDKDILFDMIDIEKIEDVITCRQSLTGIFVPALPVSIILNLQDRFFTGRMAERLAAKIKQ